MIRYKKKQAMKAKLKDAAYFAHLKEAIIVAERALLYALGFEFSIINPHRLAINLVRLKRSYLATVHLLWQSSNTAAPLFFCFSHSSAAEERSTPSRAYAS